MKLPFVDIADYNLRCTSLEHRGCAMVENTDLSEILKNHPDKWVALSGDSS